MYAMLGEVRMSLKMVYSSRWKIKKSWSLKFWISPTSGKIKNSQEVRRSCKFKEIQKVNEL
jgi:hypothetical protein